MAKKKSAERTKEKSPAPAKRKNWSASRGRTIKANGGITEPLNVPAEPAEKVNIGEAMRRAVEALGEVVVDDQVAPQQLRELGVCLEEITRRQAAFDAKAEEAKTAKKSLESAQELLLERVKAFTHPTPLPLFDNAEREKDLDEMRGGGEVQELGAIPPAATEPTEGAAWGESGFNGAGH